MPRDLLAKQPRDLLGGQSQPPENYGEPVVENGQYQVGGDNSNPFTLKTVFDTAESVLGVRDVIPTLLSSQAADIVGNYGGGIQAVLNPNDPLAGPDAKARIADTLTIQPETEKGKSIMGGLSALTAKYVEPYINKARLNEEAANAGAPEWVQKNAAAIPEFASAVLTGVGAKPLLNQKPTGAPALRTDKYGNVVTDMSKKGVIASDLRNNPNKATTAKYDLSPEGAVIKSPPAKAAINQGWSQQAVAGLKAASEQTKLKIRQMVNLAKNRDPDTGDYKSSMQTRPSDVAGDSLYSRYSFIERANDKAGKFLGKIAKDMRGTKVNIAEADAWFASKLDDFGVKVKDGKLDFSGSKLPEADYKLFRENWKQMQRYKNKAGMDFYSAHELKQILRRTGLNYEDTIAAKGASPEAQQLFKGYSKRIDSVLDGISDAYDKQNIKYGETAGVISEFKNVIKSRLYTDSADVSMGTLMRRLTGNAESRAPLMDMLASTDDIAKKYGAKFNDDLYLQMKLANEMDDVLGIAADNSFMGNTARAAEAASVANSPTGIGAVRFLKGASDFVNRRSPEKALNTLQALTQGMKR